MTFWDRADIDAEMRERFAAGDSASIVAAAINGILQEPGKVTRNAVIGRWNRMDLKRGGDIRVKRARLRAGRPPKKVKRPPFTYRAFMPKETIEPAPGHADDVARVASVLDLEEHHCRFPVRKDGFCGDRKVSGLPYCEAHVRRCYRAPEKTANRTERLNKVLEVLGSETTRKPLETVGD